MSGGFLVVLGIIVIVMVHEAGHFFAARAVGMKATEFFFGFGPRLWSTRRGETEYGVKALPLGGYVRITGMNPMEEVAPEDEGRTYRDKPFWAKSLVVLAGSATHFPLAFLLFYLAASGIGMPVRTTTVADVQAAMDDGSPTPAAVAGLLAGDTVISLAGTPTPEWGDLVEAIVERPGQTVSLGVEREGRAFSIEITLAAVDDGAGGERGYLGIAPGTRTARAGPVAGLGEAGSSLGNAVVASGRGLWDLVTGVPRLVAAVVGGDADQVGDNRPVSPIGLVGIAGDLGVSYAVQLVAYVAVFVGLLNAIPLYPLDGGHFAVALYEKLRGRPADVRRLVPVAATVIAFLVVIGLLAVYLDIAHPFRLG
ncbi:MAG: RIP metalloprotease [Actinobacteria bacterium]|nr:RIP metalloprotease [Actinomycetota bacterium]